MNEPAANTTVATAPVPASDTALPPPAGSSRVLRFIRDALPTLLILAAIGAVGWWGHHNGWKMPKFSQLNGTAQAKDDWCIDHNVPESICVECKPELMPRPAERGWCKVHGVAECTLCNSELAQLHSTPKITQAELDRAQRALDFTERPTNRNACPLHLRRIQFATARDAEKAGITVEPVWTAPALEFIAAPGEIIYDQTRVAHLSARSPGTVAKVFKHLGDEVNAGEVLALVDAAEVGKAKADLLQAFAALQLKQQMLASAKDSGAAVSASVVKEAEAAVSEAEIRLTARCQGLTTLGLPIEDSQVRKLTAEQIQAKLYHLGIPDDVVKKLDAKTTTTNLLPLVAPMAGTIVSREVVAGEVVDITRILFEVVDTRSLWLTLDVKSEDAARVKIGQTVRFKSDNAREEVAAKITWRSSHADHKTRTVKVRAEVADPERKLVANTFGTGRIILREEKAVISVPNEAVQWEGCCHVVFVRDKNYMKEGAPKVYHVRKVRLGAKDDRNTEIIAGVLPGELVVTKGGGLLVTELLRGQLGAGCACHAPK